MVTAVSWWGLPSAPSQLNIFIGDRATPPLCPFFFQLLWSAAVGAQNAILGI